MKHFASTVQVNITAVQLDAELKSALDCAAWTQDASRRIVLSGWVLHPSKRIMQICLASRRRKLAIAALDVSRDGASKAYPGYPNSGLAGFSIDARSPGRGTLRLEAVCEGGERIEFAKLSLQKKHSPRILFMHIPKTAGSAFNGWLSSHCESGCYEVHVESQPRWFSDLEYYRNLDFLSGHFTLASFSKRLDLSGYYTTTLLREPFAQLASHLAWVRKLSDEGEERRYQTHPEYIQVLSRKLALIDFTSAAELRKLVESLDGVERLLISNCQLRYFTNMAEGEQVQESHLEPAVAAARTFTRIGRTENTQALIASIARDMGWEAPGYLQRKNVSSNLYGLDTGAVATRAALEPLVKYDILFLARLEKEKISN